MIELARIQTPEKNFYWKRTSLKLFPIIFVIQDGIPEWIYDNIKSGIKRLLKKINQERIFCNRSIETEELLVINIVKSVIQIDGVNTFCFGGPNIGFTLSIQPISDALEQDNIKCLISEDPSVLIRLIRRLAAHEFGHVLGLRHCSRKCIMKNQPENFEEMIIQMYNLEKSESYLCPQCIEEVNENYTLLNVQMH